MTAAMSTKTAFLLPGSEYRGLQFQQMAISEIRSPVLQPMNRSWTQSCWGTDWPLNSDIGVEIRTHHPVAANHAIPHRRNQHVVPVLTRLTELKRRALAETEVGLEARWLAENRTRYAGRWIALQGRTLLAVGTTAREVFSQVKGQPTPPLVIKIDADDTPFGGW